MKAITAVTFLVLWAAFVACSWCEGQDISKLPGKQSPPGIDRNHMAPNKIQDINGNVYDVEEMGNYFRRMRYGDRRDPFERVK